MSIADVADQAAPIVHPTPTARKSKNWTPPARIKRVVELSSGKAEARINFGVDFIDAKIKVVTGGTSFWYRGAKGDQPIQTVKVAVKATSISLKMADGTVLRARACCKPTDEFNRRFGAKRAVQRLCKKAQGVLTKEDRTAIWKAMVSTFVRVRKRKDEAASSRSRNGNTSSESFRQGLENGLRNGHPAVQASAE